MGPNIKDSNLTQEVQWLRLAAARYELAAVPRRLERVSIPFGAHKKTGVTDTRGPSLLMFFDAFFRVARSEKSSFFVGVFRVFAGF